MKLLRSQHPTTRRAVEGREEASPTKNRWLKWRAQKRVVFTFVFALRRLLVFTLTDNCRVGVVSGGNAMVDYHLEKIGLAKQLVVNELAQFREDSSDARLAALKEAIANWHDKVCDWSKAKTLEATKQNLS